MPPARPLPSGLAHAIVRRCADAIPALAATLVPLRIDGVVAGRLTPARAQRAAAFHRVFVREGAHLRFADGLDDPVARSDAIADVAHTLSREGALSAWRDERYRVAPALDAPAWFELERAAARYFGIRTHAAHVNGLAGGAGHMQMWVARRSADKALDPGMLDNLVGGGIAAGLGVRDTVVKESWEEAGIPPELARTARPTTVLRVTRLLPDGLQDELLHVHDLALPETFVPANQDGEAAGHRRCTLAEIARIVALDAGDDAMTVDASVVALTVLVRAGTFAGDPAGAAALHAMLDRLATAAA